MLFDGHVDAQRSTEWVKFNTIIMIQERLRRGRYYFFMEENIMMLFVKFKFKFNCISSVSFVSSCECQYV